MSNPGPTMDFIFEEDSDDVGSDIESYCPKCKGDTSHTVITKYEDEVRKVQCNPCGDVHTYRKPRGEIEDEVAEPAAAKKRASAKKPTWAEARAKTSERHLANARVYSIRDKYSQNEIVSHPKFGIGFVTEISENKVELTFQDERRVLVHNRPDLAAQMPAIAPLPVAKPKLKGAKGQPVKGAKAIKLPTKVVSTAKAAPAPVIKGKAIVTKATAALPRLEAATKPAQKSAAKKAIPVAKAKGKKAPPAKVARPAKLAKSARPARAQARAKITKKSPKHRR